MGLLAEVLLGELKGGLSFEVRGIWISLAVQTHGQLQLFLLQVALTAAQRLLGHLCGIAGLRESTFAETVLNRVLICGDATNAVQPSTALSLTGWARSATSCGDERHFLLCFLPSQDFSYELCVGQNGRVWLVAPTARETVLLLQARGSEEALVQTETLYRTLVHSVAA